MTEEDNNARYFTEWKLFEEDEYSILFLTRSVATTRSPPTGLEPSQNSHTVKFSGRFPANGAANPYRVQSMTIPGSLSATQLVTSYALGAVIHTMVRRESLSPMRIILLTQIRAISFTCVSGIHHSS